MKSQFTILILSLFVFACKPKESVESIKAETMKLHDEVMEAHSKIINNQMKIDTLLINLKEVKSIDTATEKSALTKIQSNLVKAEEGMNDWMHNFNPEYTNSSEEAIIKYYKMERDKIAKVAKLYQMEIKQSDAYLTKFKKL